MKKARISVAVTLVVGLLLSMSLYGLAQGAKDDVLNPEFRIKFGVLSHWDNLFGNYGITVGGDYLFYLEDSPFGIAGGLEYTSSVRTTFYADSAWKDIATTLSFLYFPTSTREVYLGMGLEYHWVTEEEILLYTGYRRIRKDSGLGLHLVVGFNLGKNTFLEGKLSSVGIGYRNKGGISLQIGGRF